MADIPTEANYGTITCNVRSFVADSIDAGGRPDANIIQGTVVLAPSRAVMRWTTTTPPIIAAIQVISCHFNDAGELCPPGSDIAGVNVLAYDQPAAIPETVQWTATFKLIGVAIQPPPLTFNVPTGGTIDLATVVSSIPIPGVQQVLIDDSGKANQTDLVALEGRVDDLESGGGGGGSGLNPMTGLYIPSSLTTPPLQKFKKALGRATAGDILRIACVGDSIAYGQHATPPGIKGYGGVLAAAFARESNKPQPTGVIWAWTTFAGQTWRNDDSRVVWNGGTETAGYGPFGLSCIRFTGGDNLVFTPGQECIGVRVYYIKQSSTFSNFNIIVDGGSPTTYGTGGGTENQVGYVDQYFTQGTHVITVAAAASATYIVGIESLIEGVAVTAPAAPGGKNFEYNAASGDGHASWEFITQGMAPTLTIIGFGHNEYIAQARSIATQQADLETTVDRALAGGSEVILLTPVPNSDTDNTPATEDLIAQIRYDVADSRGVLVLDVRYLLTSYASDPSIYYDGIHPNAKGYAVIGNALYNILRK